MKSLLLLLISLCWVGCSGANTPANTARAVEVITVDGQVSVRGNTPFTAVMLETDQHVFYVLALDAAGRQALEPDLPARLRVTGVLFLADWNGYPYAHLRPTSMERR